MLYYLVVAPAPDGLAVAVECAGEAGLDRIGNRIIGATGKAAAKGRFLRGLIVLLAGQIALSGQRGFLYMVNPPSPSLLGRFLFIRPQTHLNRRF